MVLSHQVVVTDYINNGLLLQTPGFWFGGEGGAPPSEMENGIFSIHSPSPSDSFAEWFFFLFLRGMLTGCVPWGVVHQLCRGCREFGVQAAPYQAAKQTSVLSLTPYLPQRNPKPRGRAPTLFLASSWTSFPFLSSAKPVQTPSSIFLILNIF